LLQQALRLGDTIAWRVREACWRARFASVGHNFVFDPVTSKFVTPELLQAGDDVFLNAYAHVSGDVRLGNRVLVGPGVRLLSGNHLYAIPGFHARYLKASDANPEHLEPLRIEDDVWIGAGSIVLGGVTVGAGSVLGAGSVASRDIPPYVVAVGSPARPVRRIFDDPVLSQHLLRLGIEDHRATQLVARRHAAGVSGLPLANPNTPRRFIYRGDWFETPRPTDTA
jgi:acetyltransferase-like isoleucine patch superfamily enzyme